METRTVSYFLVVFLHNVRCYTQPGDTDYGGVADAVMEPSVASAHCKAAQGGAEHVPAAATACRRDRKRTRAPRLLPRPGRRGAAAGAGATAAPDTGVGPGGEAQAAPRQRGGHEDMRT